MSSKLRLSPFANAIIKNATTLRLTEGADRNYNFFPEPPSEDFRPSRMDDIDKFTQHTNSSFESLSDTGNQMFSKGQTISRICHRYDNMMMRTLGRMGLPKMVWIAIIEASEGTTELSSRKGNLTLEASRSWMHRYFQELDDKHKRTDFFCRKSKKLREDAKSFIQNVLSGLIYFESYDYAMRNIVIDTFIEFFNKSRLTHPTITLDEVMSQFTSHPWGIDLIEELFAGETNLLYDDAIELRGSYIVNIFQGSVLGQLISYCEERHPRKMAEYYKANRQPDDILHLPLPLRLYLADMYKVSRHWCATYFPNY